MSSAGLRQLHYSACFGMDELLEAQLSMEQGSSSRASYCGRTSLVLVPEKGSEVIITPLAGGGVDLNF